MRTTQRQPGRDAAVVAALSHTQLSYDPPALTRSDSRCPMVKDRLDESARAAATRRSRPGGLPSSMPPCWALMARPYRPGPAALGTLVAARGALRFASIPRAGSRGGTSMSRGARYRQCTS